MRTLIIAVTLFAFSNCFAQDEEEYSDWNISVNGGIIYSFGKGVNPHLNKDNYSDTYKSPSPFPGNNWSMNHYEITGSYFFSKNHELGLSLGRGSFTPPGNSPSQMDISGTDSSTIIYDGHRPNISIWGGLFYNFHYKDLLYAGIKLAAAGDFYESFHIGKKFNLKNSFFIKTEIGYSILTPGLFDYSSARSKQITLSFGLGLNL